MDVFNPAKVDWINKSMDLYNTVLKGSVHIVEDDGYGLSPGVNAAPRGPRGAIVGTQRYWVGINA